jgi:transposase
VSAGSVAVVSLDLHKKFTRAVAMDADAAVLSDVRVSRASHEEMERFFEEFELNTDVVMEATFNWPWIAGIATKCGLKAHLGDPMRVKHDRKGLPKSDRKDAISGGTLWLGKMFPEAYLAPPGVRRMRAVFRMRALFVRMQTTLKNNIHGQLFELGVTINETSNAFGDAGRRAMRHLDLDDDARAELHRKLALLDDLALHIAKLNRSIKDEVRSNEDAQLLDTLPGFAEITSHGFLAEIGTVTRLPDGRALAAYGGGLPLDNESADKDHGKRTGTHCNRFLRWITLEAVNGAVRKSARMRSLYNRVKSRNKTMPGKARVAVVRELQELAHLLLTRRARYMESPPPRPGSEVAKGTCDRRSSRPPRRSRARRPARSSVEA